MVTEREEVGSEKNVEENAKWLDGFGNNFKW